MLNTAIGVALFALLAFCLAMAGLEYAYDDPRERQAYAEQADTGAPTPLLAPESEQRRSAENEHYLREDLAAQRGMAYVAVLQTLLSSLGLFLIWETLKATQSAITEAHRATEEARRGATASEFAAEQSRRTADIAQRQLEEARIPALFVDVPDESIRIRDHVGLPAARLRFTNVGSTLVVITGGMTSMYFRPTLFEVPNPATPQFYETKPIHVCINTVPLTPGAAPYERELSCLQDNIRDDWILASPRPTLTLGGPNFFIVGWVEFRNQWGDEFSHTFGFFYSAPSHAGASEDFTEVVWTPQVKPGAYNERRRHGASQIKLPGEGGAPQ